MCHKLCHLIYGIGRFHRSKYFEAMKAGKLAIQLWLSCQYTENTLMDEPCLILVFGQIRLSGQYWKILQILLKYLAFWVWSTQKKRININERTLSILVLKRPFLVQFHLPEHKRSVYNTWDTQLCSSCFNQRA